jgi:hypothetical protein
MVNHPGLYSIEDIWHFFLAFCAAIVTITAAIGAVIKWVNKAKEPTTKLTKRVDDHDRRLDEHDERFEKIDGYLANDKHAIESIEESNCITQASLLAIMEQLLNPDDNKNALKEAKDDLNRYLINRKK